MQDPAIWQNSILGLWGLFFFGATASTLKITVLLYCSYASVIVAF